MKKSLLAISLLFSASTLFAQEPEKIYYFDDFEWLEPATSTYKNADGKSISDNVGQNFTVSQYNPQMKTGIWPEAPKKTIDRFLEIGYLTLPESVASTAVDMIGVARNYLKISIGSKQGGIALPLVAGFGDGTEGVRFSFKWTPFGSMSDGESKFDPTKIVVIVRNGDKDDVVATLTKEGIDGKPYQWFTEDVDLCVNGSKITKDTRIIVRNADDQYPTVSGNFRWFIDELKVYTGGSAVSEISFDENAPVEYFNLQGVKVTNAENGLYIRRQGNKVEKVMM